MLKKNGWRSYFMKVNEMIQSNRKPEVRISTISDEGIDLSFRVRRDKIIKKKNISGWVHLALNQRMNFSGSFEALQKNFCISHFCFYPQRIKKK